MDLRSLAKAELHVHLEGSVTPGTLCEIAPWLAPAEVRARYHCRGFDEFLQAFKWVTSFLRAPEHYALITRRLIESLGAEGVRYAEINISAGVMLLRGLPVNEIFSAIAAEAARAPMPVRFIFDAVRHFGIDHVRATALAAIRMKGQGVIGFGIGGDEAGGPVRQFRPVFDEARAAGLFILPHAGETGGADSVRGAVECGASRIGHGIRAAEDPSLLRLLRERDIPLEICISSNVSTGAVGSLREHPVRKLYDAGVPLVLNTDDPAMFHTTLTAEYELCRREFGFSEEELRLLAANSLRYALACPPGA